MNDYEWLTYMGLCHRCRKEKIVKGKKYCFDCLERIRENNAKRYDSNKAKEYQKRRREIYQEKKAAGVCIRCSRSATHGMYCYEHSIAEKRKSMARAEKRKRERHERGLVPEKRKTNGECRWCGENAIPGMQCCERHREIFLRAGKKGKAHMDITLLQAR